MAAICCRMVTIVVTFALSRLKQAVPLADVLRELMVRAGNLLLAAAALRRCCADRSGRDDLEHGADPPHAGGNGTLYLAVVALLFGEFFSKFLLFSVQLPF